MEDLAERRKGNSTVLNASKNRHLAKCMTKLVRGLKINPFLMANFWILNCYVRVLEMKRGKRQLDSWVIGTCILLYLFVNCFRKTNWQSLLFQIYSHILSIRWLRVTELTRPGDFIFKFYNFVITMWWTARNSSNKIETFQYVIGEEMTWFKYIIPFLLLVEYGPILFL